MQAPVINMAGETVGEVELADTIFAAEINEPLMHQALMRQLANARLGTHKVKGRSEVAGGGRKPWKQKGTGRARQGSTRAAQWRGGGIIFGPTPALLRAADAAPDAAGCRSLRPVRQGAGRADRRGR